MPIFRHINCRNGHNLSEHRFFIAGKYRCKKCYVEGSQRRRLKSRYNMSIDDFNTMFNSQGKRCAICLNDSIISKNAHIDHCHKTNKVRSILCSHCNQGLGHFRDNIELLQEAIKYLEKHGEYND